MSARLADIGTRLPAATAAGAAATPDLAHAQSAGQDQTHERQAVPSDLTLRVKSLESLLVEKGLVDSGELSEWLNQVGDGHGGHCLFLAKRHLRAG